MVLEGTTLYKGVIAIDINKIFDKDRFHRMVGVTSDVEETKREILILLLELSEWKSGIVKYLSKHEKSEEWNHYQEVLPYIPQHLKLMLFLECIYTQQDNITDEQYNYFMQLCSDEPEESKKIRNHLLSNVNFMFSEDGYITIYRGEHGLSDTEIGSKYTASRNVDYGVSWTYESSVAGFFAVRTQSDDCRVYTARIHKSNILLIYDDRTEGEVIIKPMCLGTTLLDLQEEKIECNISIMQKFYDYRDSENKKYDLDEEV